MKTGRAKLQPHDPPMIRRIYAELSTERPVYGLITLLADEFGICTEQVTRILNRECWEGEGSDIVEMPKRTLLRGRANVCSDCGGPNDRIGPHRPQSKCKKCHAAYIREWRKTHPLEGEALKKARTRAHSRMCVVRGMIEQKPCEVCGEEKSERHHPDYSQPKLIVFLCRPCHLELHRREKSQIEPMQVAA